MINKELLVDPRYLESAGLEVLEKNLGSVAAARFIRQLDRGTGDYTEDRKTARYNNITVDDYMEELAEFMKNGGL